MCKFRTWNVFYINLDNSLLEYSDTVHFLSDMTEDEVKRSLITHDCYPENIVLEEVKN